MSKNSQLKLNGSLQGGLTTTHFVHHLKVKKKIIFNPTVIFSLSIW